MTYFSRNREVADLGGRLAAQLREAHKHEHALHEQAHSVEHEDYRTRIDTATAALNHRLDGMNEFRAQLTEERSTYVRRDMLDALEQVYRRDNAELATQLAALSARTMSREEISSALERADERITELTARLNVSAGGSDATAEQSAKLRTTMQIAIGLAALTISLVVVIIGNI